MNKEEFGPLMQEEMKKWDELGVEPGAYKPAEGLLGLIFRFETLHNLLVQKGLITDEEADEIYRDIALARLKEVRETVVEPMIQQARQEAIRARINPPTMRIPKNNKGH